MITTGANIGWQTLIDAAAAAGYRVERCEQRGWLVITPATPRQPSQKLREVTPAPISKPH